MEYVRLDGLPKPQYDALMALLNGHTEAASNEADPRVAALAEKADALIALAEKKTALVALANKKTDLLGLLKGGSNE